MIVHIVSVKAQRTLCGEPRTVQEDVPEAPICRACFDALFSSSLPQLRTYRARVDLGVNVDAAVAS